MSWETLYFYRAAFILALTPTLYNHSNDVASIYTIILLMCIFFYHDSSYVEVKQTVEGALCPVILLHISSPHQIPQRDATCFPLPFLFYFLFVQRGLELQTASLCMSEDDIVYIGGGACHEKRLYYSLMRAYYLCKYVGQDKHQ